VPLLGHGSGREWLLSHPQEWTGTHFKHFNIMSQEIAFDPQLSFFILGELKQFGLRGRWSMRAREQQCSL
jgi:hypothetical protein